ncbi:hypothetical protein SDC9_100935 [bioreactor metagenome]|uniref:Uncharacterized protein n=1 Tax=bioreactor metagenome TaxID=1076179 RepID=A0A645ALP9_9ZZZZ
MLGKIIDINNTDAFVELMDGTTMDVSINRLPANSKVGDRVDMSMNKPLNMLNDKMIDFF